MKFINYLIIGIVFGITLAKAEIISWYRIYEMFRFQSFHMYGVIGSAVLVGILLIHLMKYFKLRSLDGELINPAPKEKGITRYLAGGIIFGLGWAMTGACPGPLFILLGSGAGVISVVIAAALLGTYVYGILRHRLPH